MLISPYQQISNQPISVYGQSFGMPEFDGEEYDKKQKRAYEAFKRRTSRRPPKPPTRPRLTSRPLRLRATRPSQTATTLTPPPPARP